MRIILMLICLLSFTAHTQENGAYRIFNSKGRKVCYKKLLKKLQDKDVILFGELHDNPITHWLQLELSKHFMEENEVTFGFEMLEADQQQVLNAYLKNTLKTRQFLDSARLWPNYKTDYAPIVKLAKEHNLKVVATNVPRRYASMVYKKGREALHSLPKNELNYMCDTNFVVDTTLSQYQKINKMALHGGGQNMLDAQAIKDATMARFIAENLGNGTFLHFNGAFHSDFHQGIMWYLQQIMPNLNIATISTIEQSEIKKLDKKHEGRADFIICVDENMIKTH